MRPLDIRTERLVIDPMGVTDAAPLAAIINDPGVAPMMASYTLPYTEAMALERIAQTQFRDRIGFFAAIRKDGEMIGGIGIGGDPADTAYFLGRNHWGQGFAIEAMTAFLIEILPATIYPKSKPGHSTTIPSRSGYLSNWAFRKSEKCWRHPRLALSPRYASSIACPAQRSSPERPDP